MTAEAELVSSASGAGFLSGGGEMGALMRAYDWSATPLGDPSGWPQSLRSAVSIMLNSRYPIALYWGPDLALLYNDAWTPIPGEKHPAALGKPAKEVWPEIWDAIDPLFQSVVSTGEGVWQSDELLPMRRHGYLEECYFNFTFSPVRGEEGAIDGIFNAVIETTERVLSERRLRTLSRMGERADPTFRLDAACRAVTGILAENTTDVPFALVYVRDGDVVRLVSAAGLEPGAGAAPWSLPLDEEQGAVWPIARCDSAPSTMVFAAPDHLDLPSGIWPEPVVEAIIAPVLAPGEARPTAFLIAGANARRRFDEAYRSFFEFAAGHVGTAIWTARAYEEERRRAESLAEIDRAKTAFFANVSHEFRTPLTLMLGPLEEVLARHGDEGSADTRALVDTAHRNGLRLLRLVNALLDFSRIEAGRVRADFRATDLASLTAELASIFRSATDKAGLTLDVDCPPLAAPVHVDRDMWEMIVLNLLSNAFKFTLEGGIEVAVAERDGKVVLSVRDTGVGIPGDQLPRLFERFRRVEGSRGRSFEGSGIGLALVRELVALHGGTILVESALDQGSLFTVELPLDAMRPAEEGGATKRSGEPASAVRARAFVDEAMRWLPDEPDAETSRRVDDDFDLAGGRPRPIGAGQLADVLVADDNADLRQYIARLLREKGYGVRTAPDGEAALAAIRAAKPELLVTDVMMPKLDGFALLGAVRDDPALRDLPVIMLSARAGDEAKVDGLDAGADDYLTKPFSARELLARVDATLATARLRREAAEALRASEERYRLAARATNDAIWDWDLSADDVLWNDAVTVLFGYPLADVEPSAAWWIERVHPEDRERVDRSIHAAIDGKASDWIEEYRFRRADGTFADVLDRGYVVRDDVGEPCRVIGAMLDLTERKRSEAALKSLNETLERRVNERTRERDRIWTLSRDPFLVSDGQGRWLSGSPVWTELLGWSEQDLYGRTSEWMEHPDDRAKTRREVDKVAGGEPTSRFENRFRTADGSYRWFSWTAVAEGDFTYAVARDITADKQAAAELELARETLRQAQKMEAMGQLTGGVAHDFNNLLTPIVGSLDLLQRKGLGGEREHRLIAGALQSAERAKLLVQRLLAFARRQPLQATAVDLAELVGGMTDLIASTVGPHIQIIVDAEDDLPPARADANQLEMALLNLSVNARDAMPEGGVLTIALGAEQVGAGHPSKLRPGRYLRLSVADTGTGMDEETLARAVEPFFSTKGVGKGTGLGLSMAHGLASQLGGALTIESGRDAGVTIAFWLPAAETLVEPARSVAVAAHPSASGTVLLVDDEALVRMSTADMLIELGYTVVEAASANEALELIRRGLAPDLVMSDHMMPGMTGAELARIVMTDYPEVPVLIMSGYAENDDFASGLPRLTKPFRSGELAAHLASLSASREPLR